MKITQLRTALAIIVAAVTFCAAGTSFGADLDVCPSGCTYSTIQAAINAAVSGVDRVLVGPGTYAERITFSGKAITVQSTNGSGVTTIDGGGGGRVVTFDSSEGPSSILDGFTITNGRNTDTSTDKGYGAGIFCYFSSPTIQNCTVKDNVSDTAGGGIGMSSGAPTITGCDILGNYANGTSGLHTGGGGIYGYWSNPVISGCEIANNTGGLGGGGGLKLYQADATSSLAVSTMHGNTAIRGGAIYLNASELAVSDTDIYGNAASQEGGAIYNSPIVPNIPRFSRCTIRNNFTAAGNGGGILASYRLELEECLIIGNEAGGGGSGGGIYGAVMSMTNCTVSGNKAAADGGGIHYHYYWESTPNDVIFMNNTVAGNSAGGMGGGLFITNGYPAAVNSIFWGNSPEQIRLYSMADLDLTYSAVEGGNPAVPTQPWAGVGNIKENPLFIDLRPATEAPTIDGDYHLQGISPCLDRGTAAGAPAYDIDDDDRPWGMGYDMGSDEGTPILINGAFEFGPALPAPWLGTGLALTDKRVTGVAHSGVSSFRLTGSTAAKTLRQAVLTGGGAAGEGFILSGWSKSRGTLPTGGTYGLEAKVFYTDLTSARFKVGFTKSGHAWEYKQKSFTTAKDYSKIIIYLRYSAQAGRAWFDDILLELK